MNPTKTREWAQVLRKSGKFLLHSLHPSCYSYKPGDKAWVRKGLGWNYEEGNIVVVICDTD